MTERIPLIDVSALFHSRGRARERTDRAIERAATSSGFLSITGLPATIRLDAGVRRDLLRLFTLNPAQLRPLWRQKFAPENPNVYRGWFPLQPGNLTAKEGIDLGADVAYGGALGGDDDPLCEPTPLPDRALLPGWHESVAACYRDLQAVSEALMRSLARALLLEEHYFDAAFRHGLSTLRLLRYPVRDDLAAAARTNDSLWQLHGGERRYVSGAPHVDSGFLTLLAQDAVAGLQARGRDGAWCDVPPAEGTLAVNFGRVLERWSGGRIRATEHRVLGTDAERFSIAYFHEARADAQIRPLPIDPPSAFAPFLYGDFLWATITQYVEFRGMEGLRRPRADAR